jgi:hypothetical protein
MRAVRAGVWLALGMVAGWYLTPTEVQTEVRYETTVLEVPAVHEREDTPLADALVDWDEVDRQTDCLWTFLQDHFGYDLTLERVLYAGWWTDELGGACAVIGGE